MDDLLNAFGIAPPTRTPTRVTERLAMRGRRVLILTQDNDDEWVWVDNKRAISNAYWNVDEGCWHIRWVPERIWYEWARTGDVRSLDGEVRSFPMALVYVEAAETVTEVADFTLPEGAIPTVTSPAR